MFLFGLNFGLFARLSQYTITFLLLAVISAGNTQAEEDTFSNTILLVFETDSSHEILRHFRAILASLNEMNGETTPIDFNRKLQLLENFFNSKQENVREMIFELEAQFVKADEEFKEKILWIGGHLLAKAQNKNEIHQSISRFIYLLVDVVKYPESYNIDESHMNGLRLKAATILGTLCSMINIEATPDELNRLEKAHQNVYQLAMEAKKEAKRAEQLGDVEKLKLSEASYAELIATSRILQGSSLLMRPLENLVTHMQTLMTTEDTETFVKNFISLQDATVLLARSEVLLKEQANDNWLRKAIGNRNKNPLGLFDIFDPARLHFLSLPDKFPLLNDFLFSTNYYPKDGDSAFMADFASSAKAKEAMIKTFTCMDGLPNSEEIYNSVVRIERTMGRRPVEVFTDYHHITWERIIESKHEFNKILDIIYQGRGPSTRRIPRAR